MSESSWWNLMGKRSNGQVVWETRCGNKNATNFFLKDYWEHGDGDRRGVCGTKKDHKRMYFC